MQMYDEILINDINKINKILKNKDGKSMKMQTLYYLTINFFYQRTFEYEEIILH